MTQDARIVVVRVIDRLNVGGPAIHAVLTSRGLDPTRYRTVLVYGSVEPGEADMGYLLEGSAIEAVNIPALGRELRPLRDLKTAWELYKVIRREKPHVVHTHKAKAGALGRITALLARVPVRVHTFHGHVFHGYFSPMKTRVFLGIERALARASSGLIALSQGLAKELSSTYKIAGSDRFHVVPLGLDLARFAIAREQHRGALRRELGVVDGVRLIGIIGRMVPVKDHSTFVRAAAILAARCNDVRFVFVGGGELEEQVRTELSSHGVLEKSHLLGWRRDLERIYPDLDVCALSSVNEGTPVTLIEAMASGIPVASTEVGGVGDLLAGGARGELAPACDPDALARAIERALTPGAKARAERLRDEIVSEYGGERLCRDLAALYEELL